MQQIKKAGDTLTSSEMLSYNMRVSSRNTLGLINQMKAEIISFLPISVTYMLPHAKEPRYTVTIESRKHWGFKPPSK